MQEIFREYQKLIHSREKLVFLHESLCKANTDICKTNIINCLIALENNYISMDNLNSDGNIVRFCREYFNTIQENRIWWIFTEGILYLKLGKYNLDISKKAKVLFEELIAEPEFKEKPSFYLFFLGHAAYEIGKIDNDITNSKKMLQDALKCFEEIIYKHTDLEDSYKAIIYNMQGNIHIKLENLNSEEKRYDDSEKLYNKAIELKSDFAFPYNGLGNIYRERGKYISAIENYKIAARLEKDFMYPWNYLGDCFRHLEKYEIAYKCYKRAIDICKDNSIIFPIYGLGRICYELGNRNNNNEKYFEKAVTFFLKVLQKSSTRPPQIRFTLKDLGEVYQKLGLYSEAIEVYKQILDYNLFSKQRNYEALIEESRKICEEKQNFKKNCSLASKESMGNPLDHVMCQIFVQEIEKRVYDMKESFGVNFLRREKIGIDEFNEIKSKCSDNEILREIIRESVENDITTYLHVLRRWNSYTPIINNGRGGGYFLKVDDTGIVIDPGFNFVKSFKEAKHSFSDINILLLSHSHDDHTSDVESILNLQHRYNTLLKETVLPRELAKERRITAEEVKKNPSMKSIVSQRYSENKKRLVLYTSEGVYTKFSGILKKGFLKVNENKYFDIINNKQEDYKKNDIFLKILEAGDRIFINEKISVYAIKANHKDLIENQQCLGFVIELDDTIIVYTGDTGWYDKTNKESLQKQYEDIQANNEKCKKLILIAHLGGFKDEENKYWYTKGAASENGEMYYDHHLGRIGLVKLVEALKPDICIISEFGEEFNGLRIKITEIFQEAFTRCRYKTKFIPGDIGLFINLEKKANTEEETASPGIKVISKIDFKNKKIIYENVAPDEVSVGEYRDKNSLFYYKKNANIIESDCIQAFLDGFADNNEKDGSFLKLDV